MLLSELVDLLDAVSTERGYTADCPACLTGDNLSIEVNRADLSVFLVCGSGCRRTDVAKAAGMAQDALNRVDCDVERFRIQPPPLRLPDATDTPQDTGNGERFGAKAVFDFARERYRLGRTRDGLAFAVAKAPDAPRIAREVCTLRPDVSKALVEERGLLVGRETMKAAIDTLEAYAEDAPVTEVGLRAVEDTDTRRIVLDLGTPDGRVVVVDAAGWQVESPREGLPIFRRTAATSELPTPVPGGSLDPLRDLLGLAEDDERWLLVRGWLIAAVFEKRPRPLLWALGPQGSGKSTRARMIRNVVDPVDALGREPGKNEKDDTTSAFGRFLPSFDNISAVSTATSDWLCRLVTGVEVTRRALWTNDDLRSNTFRRSGVATSIVLPHGLKADAVERLVVVEFERVPEDDRRTESALWSTFAREHAAILGALLDLVAAVLARLPEVEAERRPLPRMSDYAVVLLALDRVVALDEAAGHFAAYSRNVGAGMAERAHDDPTLVALMQVVDAAGGTWQGNSDALRHAVNARLDGWDGPKSGRGMSAVLRVSAETLRAAGYVCDYRPHGRRWTVRRVTVDAEAVTVDRENVTVDGGGVTVAERGVTVVTESRAQLRTSTPREKEAERPNATPGDLTHDSTRETVTNRHTVTVPSRRLAAPSLDDVFAETG